MAAEYSIQLKGMKELQKKLNDPKFVAGPLHTFLEKAGRTVELKAKENSPVDTGRLRASIKTKVDPLQAMIGPNVTYAPFVEFGTRPHFPPLAAMQPWAKRHGFGEGPSGAFAIAMIIARHGTRAHPYLLPALNDSRSDIERYLKDMGFEIERKWGK